MRLGNAIPSGEPLAAPSGRSLAWAGFSAISQIAVRLIALIVLSWLLTPLEFGYYSIALSLALILATVGQFGIPMNLILIDRLVPASFAAAVLLGLLLSTAIVAVYLVGLEIVLANGDPLLRTILAVFAPFIGLQVLLNILDAVARRIFAFKALALCELFATIFGNLPIAISLAYHGWGTWSLIIGHVVGAIVQAIGLLYICRRYIGVRTSRTELARVVSGGVSITVAEAANLATVHAQRPLIGFELGPAAAGLWARFYQIILIQLSCLVQPLDRLVIPSLARASANDGKNAQTMLLLIEIVALLTIPVSVFTMIAAPYLVAIALGPAWMSLVLPLQIGAITLFFRGIDRVLLSAARVMGHIRSRAAAQVAQLALVIGSVFWATSFGLTYVAAAYVAAQAISLALMLWIFSSGTSISFRELMERLAPGVVTGLLMGLVALSFYLLTSAGAVLPAWVISILGVVIAACASCGFIATARLSPALGLLGTQILARWGLRDRSQVKDAA